MVVYPTNPVVIALPYLPLSSPVVIGPWRAEPLAGYEGEWFNEDFERLGRAFLSAFRRPNGEVLERPSVVSRADSGIDGNPPSEAELRSLGLAIGFAVLDANPNWEPGADGFRSATADNAEVWVQPIDLAGGFFTLQSGFRIQTLAGGLRLNNELVVPVPVEIHFPWSVRPDSELATTVYDLAVNEDGSDGEIKRLLVAIDWLLACWRNTPSLSWESRLVQMKTAFEALLDQSDTPKAMPLLRQVFEAGQPYPTDTLWRPEEPTRQRRVKDKVFDVTLIEHWYGALSDARNAIIHEGRRGSDVLVYAEEGSPYKGPFVDIGDRVLREAIKSKVVTVGHPRAAMTVLERSAHDWWENRKTDEP